MLCHPIKDQKGVVIAVIQAINKRADKYSDGDDAPIRQIITGQPEGACMRAAATPEPRATVTSYRSRCGQFRGRGWRQR
jgi:hypothetical protein